MSVPRTEAGPQPEPGNPSPPIESDHANSELDPLGPLASEQPVGELLLSAAPVDDPVPPKPTDVETGVSPTTEATGAPEMAPPNETQPARQTPTAAPEIQSQIYSRAEALHMSMPAAAVSRAAAAPLELAPPGVVDEQDRSIAGRLVLATDALAELNAFGRDEDPLVNRTVAEVARTVPNGGLDDSGYRAELAALAAELPSLVDQLDVEVVSDNLLEVTTLLTPSTIHRLEAGETGFLEPRPFLGSIADLLRRGGAPVREASEEEVAADSEARLEFVRRFGDPLLFPTEPAIAQTTPTSVPSFEAARTVPVPPAIDEPTTTRATAGLLIVLGVIVTALALLTLLGHHLAKRSTRSGREPSVLPSDLGAVAVSPSTSGATLANGAPLRSVPSGNRLQMLAPERPGSLVELLDASRRMTASLDVAEIATIAIAEARAIVDAEAGMLVRRTDTALVPIAADPASLFATEGFEHSVLRRVVDTGRTVSAVTTHDAALVEVPVAMASVGIVANGSVIGALIVVRRPTRQFSPAELDALEMLAPLVGSALLAAQTHGSATALAELDSLTGLANRRSLDRDLVALRPNHVASYVMIDVDFFKTFNDSNGHAAGDKALQHVAETIERNVRGKDRVYRYGGEEFCVLLPGASAPEAAQVAERVRAAVESSAIAGGENQPGGRLTISVGVADTTAGISDIVDRADGALYQAKEQGRNRVAIARAPE